MSAHDRYLAGYSSYPCTLACRECDARSPGALVTEYGQTWTEPEECPACGSPDLEEDGPDEGPDPDDLLDRARWRAEDDAADREAWERDA